MGFFIVLIAMLAAVTLLADATPAAATAAAPAAKPAPAAKSQASDIVCHKEYTLGSNIPSKVCHSKSEDAENRAESRMTVEHIQAMTPAVSGH